MYMNCLLANINTSSTQEMHKTNTKKMCTFELNNLKNSRNTVFIKMSIKLQIQISENTVYNFLHKLCGTRILSAKKLRLQNSLLP